MTHDERVYHHLYVESKSPLENAECIASLEELVEELQAENAKLRSELESVGTAAYLYGCSDLKAENAKLRMFIDLKETCWKYVGWCDECPYNSADDEHDDFSCTVQEKINLLTRELGIEVDA